ncbi:MAG: cobalt ECF transporter T component CbiQ [Nitrospirota bacterium]
MHVLNTHTQYPHMLEHVDARLKLLVALTVLVMVLTSGGALFPLFVLLACLCLSAMIGAPARTVALRFSEPLFLAAMVVLLKMMFAGKEVLFSADVMGLGIVGHKDGLVEGLRIAARIMGAVSVVALLGFATPFNEFMAGLSWLRVPRGFIEILMFAYRYVFVLFEDAMVIYQAQKNRLGYSTVGRGLGSFGTLAGSLTIRAFDHSQSTTVAMVQRGYDGTLPALMHRPFKSSEIVLSVFSLLVMGAVWKIL